MKKVKAILIVSIALVSIVTLCEAQTRPSQGARNETGRILGVVLDANNARVVGARILIEGGYARREMQSGAEGDFELELPAGDYQITVEAAGFRRFEISPFRVKSNVTEMINLHLEVGVIDTERRP